MKNINFYALVLSSILNAIQPQENYFIENANNYTQTIEDKTQNESASYQLIKQLLNTILETNTKEIIHQNNDSWNNETQSIEWEKAFNKIKENNKIYLEEHPELYFLELYSDQELQDILTVIKNFINIMNDQYEIDFEQLACKLNSLEILKDNRIPALEVPYFGIFDGLTQTINFLEDYDEEYFKITIAHETFHLLQSSCPEILDHKVKQSVWEEPISVLETNEPTPLRTIVLDEYLAYNQAQKINPDYPSEYPYFELIELLELALLPIENYQYLDTLTTLSLSQDNQGFYDLFHATTLDEKSKVHEIFHAIDINSGYFNYSNTFDEENYLQETKTLILVLNNIFYNNLINSKENISKDYLFYLLTTIKTFSHYILDSYCLESYLDSTDLQMTFKREYQELESQILKKLEEKYQDNFLTLEYQNYILSNEDIMTTEQNQKLLLKLNETTDIFYQFYQNEKTLSKVLLP